MTITRAEAAQAVGMKESEVVEAVHVDEGTSVRLFDGSELLLVPADRPDAAGRSGVMLRAPLTAQDILPVYDTGEDPDEAPAAEGDDDDDAEAPAKPAKRAAKKAAVKAPAAEGDDDDDA